MCGTCGCQDAANHAHKHEHTDKTIALEKEIMQVNDDYAGKNRQVLKQKNATAINFVSSPGSGKTSLLEASIKRLIHRYSIKVVEGDQQTQLDAERIRRAGADAYQINTGKACHLDAHMIGHAFEHLDIQQDSFVFIENVGNLICPAMFDLGEAHRVALISTTEGADKPLKYPDMFYHSDIVVINKVDLLPYVDFDMKSCIKNIKKIRPNATIFELSVKDGFGMSEWCEWLISTLKVKENAEA